MEEQHTIPDRVLERIEEHGNGFRAAREAADVSIEELADRSAIALSRLHAFEDASASPSETEANALSVALGLPSRFFME